VDYQAKVTGHETDLDFVADTLEPVFRTFTAVGDLPIPALYRPLSVRYPGAKFIAFHREADKWVSSVRRHIGARALEPFERVAYWAYFDQEPTTLAEISDADLIKYYEGHYTNISTYFGPNPNFLMLPLGEKWLGQKLCQFCGLPPIPLPHVDYAMGHGVAEHISDLERDLARRTERISALESDLRSKADRISDLNHELARLRSEVEGMKAVSRTNDEQLAHVNLALDEARHLYQSMTSSLSWRLTWPLRVLRDAVTASLKKLKHR
jgi:hypothetical protein